MALPEPQRRWPSETLARVPYWVYQDEPNYRAELRRIFEGPTWNFVGLETDVARPGAFRTTFVGEMPVILVRDEDGAINAFENRCAAPPSLARSLRPHVGLLRDAREGMMKIPSMLAATFAAGLALTGAAHAATSPDAEAPPPLLGNRWDAGAGGSAEAPDAHVISGRVLKVDADEGTLVIQTRLGVLALRGPREGLRDVSVGDIVEVEMIAEEEAPSASPPMDDEVD